MKKILICEVTSRSDLKEFIYLPEKLHRNHKKWVPPLFSDQWDYFNRKKNLAFLYCDTIILLAIADGKTAGRIMGIINHHHNKEKNEKTVRFSFFECTDEAEVACELLGSVEEWARSKGMTRIIGPFGMYYHDPIGFMTEGFNEKPSTAANYNHKYINYLLESAKYRTEEDLVGYTIKIPDKLPDIYMKAHQKIISAGRFTMVSFNSKKNLRNTFSQY